MKVLFCSANCAIDASSGAAITIRTLLRLLSEQGVESRSLTGSTFDQPGSQSASQNLRAIGAHPVDPEAEGGLWELTDAGATHHVMPTRVPKRLHLRQPDEDTLLTTALRFIDDWRPDVVLTYGAGRFEKSFVDHARRRGILTVFYLANPSYKSAASFSGIDLVFSDTVATRDLYRERLGLEPYAIGKFVDPPRIIDGATRRYITFVNPAPEKGVTLFYRIAELAGQVVPELQFLVVESRATLRDAEIRSKMPFSRMPNITTVGLQKNMSEVFSVTRVLIQPSLWHESGARSAIEAMSMGIPIVATDRGGIPEVLGKAGIVIPPPPPLVKTHWLIPPLTSAIPWVEALRQLTEDADFYQEHRQYSLQSYARHAPAARVAAIIDRLQAEIARRRL
jgi:glycosyltransferase involved in cell wall biosynthesis